MDPMRIPDRTLFAAMAGLALIACDAGDPATVKVVNPLTNPASGPAAGNPDGKCAIPADAALGDVSKPDEVIGNGTAASCTAEAFIAAVAKGGAITFACGPDPVTLTLPRTAKVFNDGRPDIVIDGGGKVTLSGGGSLRILYMNTCDPAQHWTTSHCQDQDHPRLTVQNLTFVDGNAGTAEGDAGGGGAIYNDGNTMTLSLCGTLIERNEVTTHGAGIFFVTNDHTGDIEITNSIIRLNTGGSWYARPGISMHEDTRISGSGSLLE